MNKKDRQRKLIIGLGNPGKSYTETRHNVGFLFLDALRAAISLKYQDGVEINKKEYTLYEFDSVNLALIKPLTFMNNSGEVVAQFLKYHEYDLAEILLAHDDLDLELGKYKIQFARSPKGHNGIISVENQLKSIEFNRIRIGIDNKELPHERGMDYVLGRFGAEELQTLQDTFAEIIALILNPA